MSLKSSSGHRKLSLLTTFMVAAAPLALSQITVNLDATSRGAKIGDLHYGIFYEEINNAGDGGLYGELIRNRSFEDGDGLEYWTPSYAASAKAVKDNLLNDAQGSAVQITLKDANQGLTNSGYWGINCRMGCTYRYSFWLKSDAGYNGTVTAAIVNRKGEKIVSDAKEVKLNGKWVKLEGTLTPGEDDANAKFKLEFSNSGTVEADMVSLFPPTFKDRENGCRKDLAEMLAVLHPAFVRFPGGCYIEGDGSVEDNRRFEWKKTIGPVETRPGHFNYNWGYPSTDGLGFHEFLQLTEDLGAEPLFVVNIGIGHGWYKDYTDIDEYIQEALDAIEYCNGDADTFWGAQRAANGHPEPFNLRLMEIGNENYNFDDDRSDHYAERYKAFYDAIKAKYPEVTLIGNVEAWGTDDPSWRNSNHCEIVDEHYYRSPSWFEMKYNKYDSYDRSGPKVYVGEYAVTDKYGTNGNLRAALGEAVYMMGMERNSDVVVMNSYAPIFYNEERGGGWLPDMIRFSHSQSYGTPSYHVQKLMANNHGDYNIGFSEINNMVGGDNKIGVATWNTVASFDNVSVMLGDGNQPIYEDFNQDADNWKLPSGWTVTGGSLKQTNGSKQGEMAVCNTSLPSSYTLELDAKKESGAEGFLIMFNYADGNNYCWWNIGGWNNTQHGIQYCKDGGKTDIDLKPGSVEGGVTYKIKIEVDGDNVKCFLDGKLIHDILLPVERRVYVSASADYNDDIIYLKIVNTKDTPTEVTVNMENAAMLSADVTLLTSASALDENTSYEPEKVLPSSGSVKNLSRSALIYNAPANSLSIIKINTDDIAPMYYEGEVATDEEVKYMAETLKPLADKLTFLHQDCYLPDSGDLEIGKIEWEWTGSDADAYVEKGRFSTVLRLVAENSDHPRYIGKLRAYAHTEFGRETTLELPVTLAPSDAEWAGYLYTFMNPASETTNYALAGRETLGKRFNVLLEGGEIFPTEELAPIEGGTRDAYMARGQRGDEYFMTTTDMCNAKTGLWNNFGIDLLRSSDLVHWESTAFDFRNGKSIFSDPDATTDGYKSNEEYSKINRVWAPQFIYDDTAFDGKGGYLVYYSILSSNPGDAYDRMFYSYADKDFKTLTQPRLFYDPGYSVIDADIVLNPYDGLYHMMIKNGNGSAGIYEYVSDRLVGGDWKEVLKVNSDNTSAVEGPTLVRRLDEDCYNLYYMRYDGQYKYKVVDMDHACENPGLSMALSGNGNFQHGSVMYVNSDEFNMLNVWSDVMIQLKKARKIKSDTDTNIFDEAIAVAEKALADNRSVSSLLEALPVAYEALVKANGDYLAANPDEFNDITDMIVNPDFNGNNGNGWSGTPFTATASGVAEQYSKNYDTYQVIENMPAGTYRLECQGFYRYGFQAASREAHVNGTEQLLAILYINDMETPFMSLYDDVSESVPDNVMQSNTAFNTDHRYEWNSVECVLPEPGALRIGVKKNKEVAGDWNCFDNFRLFYKPSDAGIDIMGSEPDNETFYDIHGIRVSAPGKGVFIRKSGSKVEKIIK